MAPERPEASYSSQIPTQPQELVYEPVALEEPMDSIFSDMTNLSTRRYSSRAAYTHHGCKILLDISNHSADTSVSVLNSSFNTYYWTLIVIKYLLDT